MYLQYGNIHIWSRYGGEAIGSESFDEAEGYMGETVATEEVTSDQVGAKSGGEKAGDISERCIG